MMKRCIMLLGCVCLLLMMGCEKELNLEVSGETDKVENDCFISNDCLTFRNQLSLRNSTDTFIQEVQARFMNDEIQGKKNALQNKHGYPVWDAAYTEEFEPGAVAFVPMVKINSNEVEAVLMFSKSNNNDKLRSVVSDRKKVKKLPLKKQSSGSRFFTKEGAIIQFMYFDKLLFDYVDCEFVNILSSSQGNARYSVGVRDCQWITYGVPTDWYQVNGDGSTSYLDTTWDDIETIFSCPEIEDAELTYPNFGDLWEMGTYSSSGGVNDTGTENDTLEYYIPSLLNDIILINADPCINSIYFNLKQSADRNFKNILNKLDEVIHPGGIGGITQNPRFQYNWKIIMGDCGSSIYSNACTGPIQYGIITTKIDVDRYENASNLSLARTLIHEAFHAYLTYEYTYRGFISTDYGDLIEEFAKDFSGEFNNLQQHKFFVEEKIVDEIAGALYNYALNEGIAVDLNYC